MRRFYCMTSCRVVTPPVLALHSTFRGAGTNNRGGNTLMAVPTVSRDRQLRMLLMTEDFIAAVKKANGGSNVGIQRWMGVGQLRLLNDVRKLTRIGRDIIAFFSAGKLMYTASGGVTPVTATDDPNAPLADPSVDRSSRLSDNIAKDTNSVDNKNNNNNNNNSDSSEKGSTDDGATPTINLSPTLASAIEEAWTRLLEHSPYVSGAERNAPSKQIFLKTFTKVHPELALVDGRRSGVLTEAFRVFAGKYARHCAKYDDAKKQFIPLTLPGITSQEGSAVSLSDERSLGKYSAVVGELGMIGTHTSYSQLSDALRTLMYLRREMEFDNIERVALLFLVFTEPEHDYQESLLTLQALLQAKLPRSRRKISVKNDYNNNIKKDDSKSDSNSTSTTSSSDNNGNNQPPVSDASTIQLVTIRDLLRLHGCEDIVALNFSEKDENSAESTTSSTATNDVTTSEEKTDTSAATPSSG